MADGCQDEAFQAQFGSSRAAEALVDIPLPSSLQTVAPGYLRLQAWGRRWQEYKATLRACFPGSSQMRSEWSMLLGGHHPK